MIFDWIAREGWIVVNWWLVITLMGLTVLPLLARMLNSLPDRGYTLARPAGMLLVSAVFWLLAVLGFVNNTAGSILLAWIIVLLISLAVYFRAGEAFDWRAWWSENRRVVVATEILFVVLLLGWSIYRAHQNELSSTEKPMDLAFMSASQRSLTYPPDDPWLAGYAISYYYFGYVMGAMFSTLNNVPTTIGFNMHISLLFALAGTTAFGIAYNLVRSRAWRVVRSSNDESQRETIVSDQGPSHSAAILVGLLAMVFVVLMGNYETLLVELPYNTGLASPEYLDFWDVNNRREPRFDGGTDNLAGWDHWWWFRGARSISDKDMGGNHEEVIAEFPNFSFLLADSHPHVMALPFALLSMGLALHVLLSGRSPGPWQIGFYGVCVGSLVFLNTWDAPVYILLLVGADALRRILDHRRLNLDDWIEMAVFGIALVGVMLVVYFPFLVGFRSQLNGILPNVINPTQFPQLFLMFGPYMLILGVYVAVEVWRGQSKGLINFRVMGWAAASLVAVPMLWVLVLVLLRMTIPNQPLQFLDYAQGEGVIVPTMRDVVDLAFDRRLASLLTPILPIIGLVAIIGRIFPAGEASKTENGNLQRLYPPAAGFVLMLIGAGLVLVFIPEFAYLRDNFGSRMNTVFKFYYQAWAAFSIAAAYAIYSILADREQLRPTLPVQRSFAVLLIPIIGAGMLYPALGIHNRAFVETGRAIGTTRALTLDSGPTFISSPDDYTVIMCLRDLVGREEDVVVAEAQKHTYRSYYGRVGALTGIPVVANWLGHQAQWRGTGYGAAVGSRGGDLNTLYTESRLDMVQGIIERYGIDYILYGSTERNDFGSAGEEKFRDAYEAVCEAGNSRIYRVGSRVSVVSN